MKLTDQQKALNALESVLIAINKLTVLVSTGKVVELSFNEELPFARGGDLDLRRLTIEWRTLREDQG